MSDVALSVRNLKTFFYAGNRSNKAKNGKTNNILKGKTLCVVGESGCGKSVTASATMQLLPTLSRIEEGSITYHSDRGDIHIEQLPRNGSQMRAIRGAEISMIFQDPMTALNPVFTIGFQIAENLRYHTALRGRQLRDKVIDLLRTMGIPLPERRVDEFPHQFSGGMRQRGMIAMAMACNPKILLADEPTTALDVTIQAQIFELMGQLKRDHGTAIMLITHDMGVVAELADDVAVMYMGNIVEAGSVEDVLRRPVHPYTRALLASMPVLGRGKNQMIEAIPGTTPDPIDRPKGCQFAPRCPFKVAACDEMPAETQMTPSHRVMCWRHQELSADAA